MPKTKKIAECSRRAAEVLEIAKGIFDPVERKAVEDMAREFEKLSLAKLREPRRVAP